MTGTQIEAAVTPRTKAILINYPNNPTGAVLDPERMLEIAAVAARHDLLVISDEIYDRLRYGGATPPSAACPACATGPSSSAASRRTTP